MANADERTRLLDADRNRASSPGSPLQPGDNAVPIRVSKVTATATGHGRTPLPWSQLLIILFCRFTEPVAFTVIFPFINQMIEELHITEPQKVGYYAGVIESLFALAQFCTVLQIGRAADRIGRKPVIIFGLLGAALSTLLFGFSRSWIALIVSRSLAGALNGNAGVIKVVLAELTDESNKGVAFALLPLTWAVGASLGSLIGGYLSNPARFAFLSDIQLLRAYPYLLPCFVASLCPMIGATVTACCLRETLPTASHADIEGESRKVQHDTVRSLLTEQVRAVLLNYGLLALHTISLAALIPLYSYTKTAWGGLSLSTKDIGLALSVQGLAACFLQLVAYPPLQRRFGTLRLYRATVLLYPVVFALMPLLHVVAVRDSRPWLFASIGAILVLAATANLCYSSTMLLVADAAPRRQSLGAVNGLAQSVASLMRSVGPAAATSLFAYSIEHALLGGRLVWLVLFSLALINFLASFLLTDVGAVWRLHELEEDGGGRGSASA